MPRYSKDPYWLSARFASDCSQCRRSIKKGEDIFYYPIGKRVLCNHPACGGAASAEFEGARADEDRFNGPVRHLNTLCQCGSSSCICPECGDMYEIGSTSHCTRKACRKMNAPVDCYMCGFVVASTLDGVIDFDGNLIPFQTGPNRRNSQLATYRVQGNELTFLPDNRSHTNRFEIGSSSSDRVYIVALRKTGSEWCCSCPGWIRYRHCKHLRSLTDAGILREIVRLRASGAIRLPTI